MNVSSHNNLANSGSIQTDILTIIAANPKLADSTKRQYSKAIINALRAGVNLFNVDDLTIYAQGLTKSSRAFLKAAIRLWGKRLVLEAKSGATPETVAAVQATVFRVETLVEAIQVKQSKGQKAHIWLTRPEVIQLLESIRVNTIKGQRDKIVLGLLVGAGLRREELVDLTFEDVLLQPVADKPRTVLNVRGKGAKDRVVPINVRLASALYAWQAQIGPGQIARSIAKNGKVGENLSPIGIFQIVRVAGQAIGKPHLAPHDLRRTYAQLGYEAGVPISQISKLLGHASVATTQRYLNLDLDLETTISDYIPFR